jgi:hypothetical protein
MWAEKALVKFTKEEEICIFLFLLKNVPEPQQTPNFLRRQTSGNAIRKSKFNCNQNLNFL